MFYRYVSENLTAYINEGEAEAGNKDFDYAKMNDADVEEAREGLVEESRVKFHKVCKWYTTNTCWIKTSAHSRSV